MTLRYVTLGRRLLAPLPFLPFILDCEVPIAEEVGILPLANDRSTDCRLTKSHRTHLSSDIWTTRGKCKVWPDLANFRHLGKTLKVFGYSLRVYFVFGKTLTLIGQIFMKLNKFSLLLMAQYWKDNLAIWSHCKCIHLVYLPRVKSKRQRERENHKQDH